MLEGEFYDENASPKKIIIGLVLIIVICLIGVLTFRVIRSKHTLTLKDNLKFEAGSTVSYDIEKYVSNDIVDENDYQIFFTGIPIEDDVFTTKGDYTFKVKYKNVTKTGKLKIVDTKGPVIEVEDLTIGVNDEIEADDFVTSCEDYSKPCDVEFKNKSDSEKTKKVGTYTVDIVVSDTEGNKTTKTARLTVKKDYSFASIKETDFNWTNIDPEYEDFDGTLYIKFSKAVPNETDDIEALDEYDEILELVDKNWRDYLPSEYNLNAIYEKDIIWVYNKYDYAIGVAARVKLDNGKIIYFTKTGYHIVN